MKHTTNKYIDRHGYNPRHARGAKPAPTPDQKAARAEEYRARNTPKGSKP